MIRRLLCAALASALSLVSIPAAALDVADGKLQVNAFGSAGYGRTDGNVFDAGAEGGSYENLEFALAFTAHPSDRLVIAGQVGQFNSEYEVDWAFAEWRFSDALRFRAGQIKTPLGISSEVMDVGTLRPFFSLPTSIYGASGVGMEAFRGVGLTGRVPFAKRWAVGWDAYGGAFESERLEPYNVLLLDPPLDPDVVPVITEVEETKNFFGGRLVLFTPIEGLDLRVSGFRGEPEDEDLHASIGLSVNYEGERFWVRAEGFRVQEDDTTGLAGYVEVAAFVTSNLQLAIRTDAMNTELEGFAGESPLLEHREWAVGASWWFTRDFVLKASLHDVHGNRFTLPAEGETSSQSTRMVVLGSQFSF